ncbi:MAG: HNH endonuclease [FCB group bacterium]|jgi:putative restriction endonuclease|nr:HNH endonuclease [FCB group bacterium]
MNKIERKAWTREELMLAINLYCRTPFGKIDTSNPEIIALAHLLSRTPGSVSYKLANFASIDPSLPRKGASNVSKLDKEVWNDFFASWNEMAYQSEMIASEIRGETLDSDEDISIPDGRMTESIVKLRVNQAFFRKMVLASYDNSCCITGLPMSELLVASHIVPWARDTKNRTNPRNGLCLNTLHDKAFDVGLITIDEGYKLIASSRIRDIDPQKSRILSDYIGVKIRMPKRFLPDEEFLRYHRENVFRD